MLRPKRDEVVYRRSVVSLNVCAKELPSLREPDCVEAMFEFCNVCNLFSDKVDLFVHVSVLHGFDEQFARTQEAAFNVRIPPYVPGLGPPQCRPSG